MEPAYKILAVEFDETIFRRDLKTWKYEANWEVVQYIRQKAKEGWDIKTHGGCMPLRDSQIRFTGMS